MKKGELSGQRALVTGASSGIGAELARALAARGSHLVLTARRVERLEALAKELRQQHGIDVHVLPADLAQPGAAEAIYASTEGDGLAIDILVNNAGLGAFQRFTHVPWDTYHTVFQVNVVALTQLVHLFLPRMVERRCGRIMNVSSIGAWSPCPDFAVYAATKAYVRNFTEAIDHELHGTCVRAICVCPGGTHTEFSELAGQRLRQGGHHLMMPAKKCATIAVTKMLAGRRTVVTGSLNAFGMFLLRFVPRAWMPGLARRSLGMAVDKVQPANSANAANESAPSPSNPRNDEQTT